MSAAKQAPVPSWSIVVSWSFAVGLAILGIVLAVVSNSFWPLIAFAGLAIPMTPVGSWRSSRRAHADPR
ncbi:hypothetical protein ACFOE1_09315 [Agromyces mediolanus]|uniref:hypothetical protein n=1 Tax=Agromyces mediolanus TaxID=41986 RepID=UPI0016689A99|nr:hypothetical protein [Agromyces mediolanus]